MKRIFRRRSNKNDRPLLHRREQGVLSGAVEAMHLIQEQNCLGAIKRFVILRLLNNLANVFYRGVDRIKTNKFRLSVLGNNMSKRCFSAARRTIQQN
ncbi:hypothetical protein D3C80_1665710 [compost metagenome]